MGSHTLFPIPATSLYNLYPNQKYYLTVCIITAYYNTNVWLHVFTDIIVSAITKFTYITLKYSN